MKNLIKNIQYFILSLKEKSLLKSLKGSTEKSYSNKGTKNVMTKGASLTINSKTIQTIAQVKDNVSAIVQKTNCEPEALLEYIKATKTPVIRLKNANKLLNLIKEEEGIIYEKEGLEAIYLSFITNQGLKFKTEPMFVLNEENMDKYLLLHNFYRWYSLKTDLPGFDAKTQKLLKRYLMNNSDEFTKSLSMSEVLALQEAIARDQEASAYVIELTTKIDGAKNVIDKIKNDGSANV